MGTPHRMRSEGDTCSGSGRDCYDPSVTDQRADALGRDCCCFELIARCHTKVGVSLAVYQE